MTPSAYCQRHIGTQETIFSCECHISTSKPSPALWSHFWHKRSLVKMYVCKINVLGNCIYSLHANQTLQPALVNVRLNFLLKSIWFWYSSTAILSLLHHKSLILYERVVALTTHDWSIIVSLINDLEP